MKLVATCKEGSTWTEVAEDHFQIINFTSKNEVRVQSPLQRLIDWRAEANTKGFGGEKEFCDRLLDNEYELFKRLFIEPSDQLINLIDEINLLRISTGLGVFYSDRPTGPATTSIGKKLSDIFNYTSWSKSEKAVNHFEKVDVKVCVYCNQEATWVTRDSKKIYTWDHYYEKVRYPYLSLCASNLIPSCHTCNSTIKTTTSFSLTTHLHPYRDDYHQLCKIRADIGLADGKHQINEVKFVVDSSRAKVLQTNSDLSLHSRYQSIDAIDVVEQLLAETQSYEMNGLADTAKLLGKPLDDVLETWRKRMGVAFSENEINRKRLGKLKLDIADQFDLI